jgi:hypothetical protein
MHDEVFVAGHGWFKVRADSCTAPTPQDLPLTVRAKLVEYYDTRRHVARAFIVILPFYPHRYPEVYDYSKDVPHRIHARRPAEGMTTEEWLASMPD